MDLWNLMALLLAIPLLLALGFLINVIMFLVLARRSRRTQHTVRVLARYIKQLRAEQVHRRLGVKSA